MKNENIEKFSRMWLHFSYTHNNFVLDTVNFLMKIKLLEFDSKDYQRYVTKDIYIIFV